MAEFRTSTRFSTLTSFWPSSAAAILKPSSTKAFLVTGANICWSSAPMMNCPFAQRLNSRKCAHASLDMLSGPERFLKQVGPQITHLPIAVSRADLTGDAQPVNPCFAAIRVLGEQILLIICMSSCRSSNPSQVQLHRTGAEKHLRSSPVRPHHCRP